MLLAEILSEVGRTRRWQEVRAAVHPKNERALQFFMKQGFEPLPYAPEVGEVILRKALR
jgi:L-amino acid N-acyltransferase YncA